MDEKVISFLEFEVGVNLLAKKFLKVFIVLAVIGFAFYFAFNMIMISLIHTKREISTPNIVGKNLYNAIEEVSKYGFGLKMDGEETNQNVPAGTILRQNPPAEMYVREGKVIKVTISRGGEIIYVPSLVGQSIRSADISLRTATLVMGEVTKRYSVVADKDTIVAQDIAAGTKVDKDSVVNLIVSDGQPPEGTILMPNFINKNLQEAAEWSLQTDMVLNITREESAKFDSGIIIRQYPEPDRDITDLKSVNVTVAERA
ncbi:MAG: PASTA domain-containing protein [Endomicrobium sp.]|nr:PASTA domain-containing protein [Endomicrobium sp.]